MSKRLTAQQNIERLHTAGRSDAEIGRALDRSADYIRLIRIGKKPGTSLQQSTADLRRRAPRRAEKPLPHHAAPRRTPNVRQKEVTKTPGGTYYRKNRAGDELFKRLVDAAAAGKKVVLRATWKNAQPYPAEKRPLLHHQNIAVYGDQPVDAERILDDLDGRTGAGSSPEEALASATVAYHARWEEVSGLEDYSLYVMEESDAGWE